MYNIQRHLAYNDWANSKLAEILSSVEPSLIDTETPSSFDTIKKTVYHVWDAQEIWFTRLKGNEITDWPSKSFTGSFEEGLKLFVESSKALHDFIASKDRDFLDKQIHYKNMKGVEYAQPVEDILFHLVNHGTFHRGQVVTMLRTLGHTNLQNTDLISYMRLQLA
jgi:uncharacterized damage-inducible protein DinB